MDPKPCSRSVGRVDGGGGGRVGVELLEAGGFLDLAGDRRRRDRRRMGRLRGQGHGLLRPRQLADARLHRRLPQRPSAVRPRRLPARRRRGGGGPKRGAVRVLAYGGDGHALPPGPGADVVPGRRLGGPAVPVAPPPRPRAAGAATADGRFVPGVRPRPGRRRGAGRPPFRPVPRVRPQPTRRVRRCPVKRRLLNLLTALSLVLFLGTAALWVLSYTLRPEISRVGFDRRAVVLHDGSLQSYRIKRFELVSVPQPTGGSV